MANIKPFGTTLTLEEDTTYFYIKKGATLLMQIDKTTSIHEFINAVNGDFTGQLNIALGEVLDMNINGKLDCIGGAGNYFILPRLSGLQIGALTPQAGMTVYNLSTNKAQTYNGSTWNDLF